MRPACRRRRPVGPGALVDTALRPIGGRLGTSTTYRLLARRWPV